MTDQTQPGEVVEIEIADRNSMFFRIIREAYRDGSKVEIERDGSKWSAYVLGWTLNLPVSYALGMRSSRLRGAPIANAKMRLVEDLGPTQDLLKARKDRAIRQMEWSFDRFERVLREFPSTQEAGEILRS